MGDKIPLMYDVQTTDQSKINPAGFEDPRIAKSYENVNSTKEDLIKALEDRYAQPNWWKVAAGFAKPQLGGFMASLGSASEALGENFEQQRAIQPTIANMRSQLAQQNLALTQSKIADEILQKEGVTPESTAKIVRLAPESPQAKALLQSAQVASTQAGTKSTELNTQVQAVAASGKDPRMNALATIFAPDVKPEERKAAEKVINDSKPPQIEYQTWLGMSPYDKQESVRKYAESQRESGLTEEEKSREQAKSAYDRLPLLRNIRETALGFGVPSVKDSTGKVISGQEQMAGLLNYFGGNNPIEVIARAAADGKFGDLLAGIDAYARQSGMSPEARDNFQKLVKMLNENQISMRGSTLNPTDAFSSMQTMASPNIGNSQKALVTLVDLMGHSEKHAQDRHGYMVNSGVPSRQLRLDPQYLSLEKIYADQHSEIAKNDPTKSTPSWYNPQLTSTPTTVVTATPSAKPTVRPSLPPGFHREGNRIVRD